MRKLGNVNVAKSIISIPYIINDKIHMYFKYTLEV